MAPPGFSASRDIHHAGESGGARRSQKTRRRSCVAEALELDGVQPHQADVAERGGQLARVIEFRAAVPPVIEALVSSSIRTGTRGSIWNIFRNIFSSRM